MYKSFFKRFIDVVLGSIGLVILAIPMLIIALMIKVDSPGPVLFKQQRLGRNGRAFWIYKFRSMCVDAEKQGVYSDNKDSRVTRVGKILRALSLDELPQLLNILKGDMALIGPRPPLTYHPWPLVEYTEEQKRMFEARPGITGWAQVNGRKDVEWNHRIELNVWYVNHISLVLDLKIFFLTIYKVLANKDNENKGATVVHTPQMEEETLVK